MSKATKTIELQLFKTLKVEELPTLPDKLIVKIFREGELLSNKKTIIKHNAITIKKNYAEDSAIDEIINDYLTKCIDENRLSNLLQQFKPKQAFLRVHVPVKSSKWCQDDLIEKSTLAKLANMKLDLDFWFT